MSRAAFSSFARNIGRSPFMRKASVNGMKFEFMNANSSAAGMRFVFPEMAMKNNRMSQLVKLANNSRKISMLKFQKIQIGALSVLLTTTGEILSDFQDLMNSLSEEDEEELLRRTSLLVQSQGLLC